MLHATTKSEHRAVFIGLVAGSVILLGTAAICAAKGLSPILLTRDLATLADINPLSGGLSTLGYLVWAATAGVWLSLAMRAADAKTRHFAGASFLLSAYLCFDDAFLVHDFVAQYYLGIDEHAILVGLGLATIAYIGVYASQLRRTPALALLAFGSLAMSVGADTIQALFGIRYDDGLDWGILIEDGLKWFGIVFFLALALVQSALPAGERMYAERRNALRVYRGEVAGPGFAEGGNG